MDQTNFSTPAELDLTEFLTLAEAAQIMRVHKRTVERQIDAGIVPAVRFGRTLRVPVAWFDAMARKAIEMAVLAAAAASNTGS